MKLETNIYTLEDAKKRNLKLDFTQAKQYLAVAFAGKELVLHKWFDAKTESLLWALEKSYYEYR